MIFYLILVFTLIPIIELALLLEAGKYIGILNTIAVVLVTGFAGALLARSQGYAALVKIRRDLSRGILPSDELFNGVLILAGGLLLLTPGFLTDLTGFFLLIPFTRKIVKSILKKKLKGKIKTDSKYIDVRGYVEE